MATGNEFGCDVDAMAALSGEIKKVGDNIRQIVEDLANVFRNLAWEGQDAETFKTQLAGTKLKGQLEETTTSLAEKGKKVDENRQRQIQASS